MYVANLQTAPPVPPDNIVTEQDRQIQVVYEQWLTNQEQVLENQLKYYQMEVLKLRKSRKSLNSKQRVLKKSGQELTQSDTIELTKVTADQTIVQKQLENARKQSRQHGLLLQDYKNKQQSKQPINQMNLNHQSVTSPAHVAPQSPLLSPSHSHPSQPGLGQPVQSPIGNAMMQPSCSPLHSPNPMMAQSPGPGNNTGIMQSPVHQQNPNMSPYSSMQPSPRIGTPHSQQDESAFSPSAATG